MELKGINKTHKRGFFEGKLAALVEDFISSDVEIAEVVYDSGEYASPATAYSSLYNAVKRETIFAKVSQKNGKIYLKRVHI